MKIYLNKRIAALKLISEYCITEPHFDAVDRLMEIGIDVEEFPEGVSIPGSVEIIPNLWATQRDLDWLLYSHDS